MRNACGSNEHPDPRVFIQVFRLLGTYSLVKPPKNSNVAGGEILHTLMKTKDISEADERKAEFSLQLDVVLDRGTDIHIFAEDISMKQDHSYNLMQSSSFIITYVAGYVAKRSLRFTKCTFCRGTLTTDSALETDCTLIDLKSRGGLLKPSLGLTQIITMIEEAVLKVMCVEKINIHTFSHIITELESSQYVPIIGCLEHQKQFSNAIMTFYLITRMHFLSNRVNTAYAASLKKTKKLKKMSKL